LLLLQDSRLLKLLVVQLLKLAGNELLVELKSAAVVRILKLLQKFWTKAAVGAGRIGDLKHGR
jgi:hypothetical protein